MENVYRQTVAPWLGDGHEHRALELDTIGLNVKGNLYLYLTKVLSIDQNKLVRSLILVMINTFCRVYGKTMGLISYYLYFHTAFQHASPYAE